MAFRIFKRKEQRSFFPPESTPVLSSGLFSVEENPTVASCVSKIANTLSILPMQLYAHTKKGKTLAVSNPLFRILKHPAYEETPNLFYNTMIRHILIQGNAYIFVSRNDRGQVINMSLCAPNNVVVTRDYAYRKIYTINGVAYTDREILHIPYPGAGYNGTLGISPVVAHKDLIAIDNEMLSYVNDFFHNSLGSRMALELGSTYGTNYQTMGKLYAGIMPIFQKFVTGAHQAGKPIITLPDSKLTRVEQPNNAEAQLASLFERVEKSIASCFNVPYELIDSKASKYNSIESKQQDFLAQTIQPLGDHICQSFEKLLDPNDTALFIQYEYKNLLQTDTSSTIDFLAKELQSGMLSLNEARKKLGMQDIGEAGDYYWMPANLIPVTEENVEAILAKSKLALKEAEDHSTAGDDKL